MFLDIFWFEVKYRCKKISTWVYSGVFLFLTFLMIAGYGGAFKGLSVSVGGSGGNIKANSPYVLYLIISTFGYFGMLVTSAIMGSSIYKDFETGSHSLFFTSPVSKFNYFFGRFTGSMFVVLIIFFSMVLGPILATFMPFMEADKIGSFNIWFYLQPYLTAVIPVVFLTGAIFFTMATVSRKIMTTYVSGVIILIGYLIASQFLSDIENKTIAALVDPFGMGASILQTRYWTVIEKNTLTVPLSGLVLLNRALWSLVGFGILIFGYFKFKLSYALIGKVKKNKMTKVSENNSVFFERPNVECEFSAKTYFKHTIKLTFMELKGIVNNVYFIVIMLAGILFLFSTSGQIGKMFGVSTYPVTYNVLDAITGLFILFIIIIITFYSGELVWRERDVKIDQLMDSLPLPTPVFFISKVSALVLVQVIILFVIMICGILIQVFKGYYNFELILYIKILFGQYLIRYVELCFLAIFVQVLSPHKFVGHFVMIIYYIGSVMLRQFGFDHNLYLFGRSPGLVYSDMNGFGHFVYPYVWFHIYWTTFAVLLAIVASLLWVRGKETSLKARAKTIPLNMGKTYKIITSIAFIIFIFSGSYIFYNTNILNKYETNKEREQQAVDYEKAYRQYIDLPQPRIVDVKCFVDIFPKKRDFKVKGTYVLKNKTDKVIKTIHIMVNSDMIINKLDFEIPSELTLDDKDTGYYIYKLSKPLNPGDEIVFNYDLDYITKGFGNNGSNTSIVYNGTFFNSAEYFPHIGYNPDFELSEDDVRKKYDLKPKPRMADVRDEKARQNTYLANDADWVNFEATVSTCRGQVAIAPGYLQKEWEKEGRKYFHYTMDSKILNFYSFLSADYQVKHDNWKDVAIDIYYNKGHEYNVDRMIKAIKKSLDYYTENFSPYQHKQVRILEFPRYASFAQSFPNTIPFSESIGFIAKVDNNTEDDIDYPFYVTAHEVAHQWWAHQVIGGNVQGATLLSESFAQYSSLMVMKKEYGKDKMKKFLKYELYAYLRGRSMERKKELPLYRVENQQYIHYRKGSLVMYALQDYIGEDLVNQTLAKYIEKVGFQEPSYTNSIEFLNILKEVTPEKYQYLIKDMFETITLFDNRVDTVNSEKTVDGKYKVTISVKSKKYQADEQGNEKEIPINDWIDIGVLGKDGKELYLKKHKIEKNEMKIEILLDELPEKAGIDIYNKLIDRISDDNLIAVSSE